MEEEILACWRCNNQLQEDQQQTELLCHHRMHTACFLDIVHLDYTCPHCDQPINPNMPGFREHVDEETEETRVQNLYDTQSVFRDLAKKIAKKRTEISKKERAYLHCIKEKKGEIRNQLLVIQAQLEGLTETKKTEIRNSVAYKEYMAAKRSYSLLTGRLRTNYNCSERKMARCLQNKIGFRRFHPLRHRFYRCPLRRAFCYHIRI